MPLLKVNQIASYSGNTLTVGTTGDTVTLAAGASSSGFGATYNSGLNWTSTLVTSALTVSAGIGYFVNTSTAAITVTLPASPTFGSIIGIADYSGYASTNNITINPNGLKMEGGTLNKKITTDKESVFLTYTDTTRGWLPTSGVNNGTDALSPDAYSIDFLVIAGGAGGGFYGGGGAGGYRTSTQTVSVGTVITVTVGDGGAGGAGNNGSNSSISGSGLTTITSTGGGTGGSSTAGSSGGSGGGGGYPNQAGGSGNTPSTSPSQGNNGGVGGSGSPQFVGAGGGGASAVGQNGQAEIGGAGGAGTASSITGSSVTRAGGGGGGHFAGSGGNSAGGTGGGGQGGKTGSGAGTGTANTGSGGGGGGTGPTGAAGGKGVVILSLPLAKFSGTVTGSPTESTSGSNKILVFNGDGSYTA